MDADRGVGINVAEDDNAYLGYLPLVDGGENITAGEPTPLVEYHNQVGVNLDTLEVDVSRPDSSGPTIKTFDSPDQLDRGSAGTVIVTLTCSTTQVVELNFEVTGSGSGTSVSLDRTLSVTCVPNQEEGEDEE
ncbi:hypothetical protein [Halorubrum aquaticum]|uniref:hypothetical protein n=1 Tax=Halorubrum aquaticum TaxID=387340 RepID=UPI00122C4B71|nr:hypothetical protein [Halorubrum aquaticum]